MTYEKLNDTLDKKMLDFNLKLIGLLATLLVKPLAICTDPFFRKNFGERYLTPIGVGFALTLWSFAETLSRWIGNSDSPIISLCHKYDYHQAANWLAVHHASTKVIFIVGFAFTFLSLIHLGWIFRRRASGQLWHSMSRGESIFGRENRRRDLELAILGTVVLGLFVPPIGLLFFCSRVASHYLTAKQEQSLYDRYLDAMDKKIEMEQLQQALDQGVPPCQAGGLHHPLPRNFKGEHRANVARVIAAGKDTRQPQDKSPQPMDAANPGFISMVATLTVETWRARFAFLSRYWKWIVGSIVAVLIAVLGMKAVHYVQSLPSKPTTPPPHEETPKSPVTQATRHDLYQPARHNPSTEAPPPPAQPPQPAVDTAAIARAEAERQKQLEQEQKKQREQQEQARLQAIKQIQATLDSQVQALEAFRTNCELQLDSNTNRLAKLSRSYRDKLGQDNEKLRAATTKYFEAQIQDLKHFQEIVAKLPSQPDLDLNTVTDAVNDCYEKIQAANKKITGYLNELDSDIAKAPEKRGFLFFK